MIAELRYMEIQTAANLNADPTTCGDPVNLAAAHKTACMRLTRVRTALETAYEQRAGMAYIRPPGAYLRTSFAATGLQQSARLGWRNMLDQHFWQGQISASSPFQWLDRVFGGDSEAKFEQDRLDTLSEIDKQFWQNINSVRLAGAGNTNYVLVKDDIGNWYAKGLEADPESIFDGIFSNALFALGTPLNANFLQQVEIRRALARIIHGTA